MPDLFSTGTFPGDPPEQALVIGAAEGPVVVTGCAHPGIAAIAESATRQAGAPILLLAGGFHLFEASDELIEHSAKQLVALGVRHVMPTHCTAERRHCACNSTSARASCPADRAW